MIRLLVAGPLLAFALGGVVLADDAKALKELEGTYKVTGGAKGGVEIPETLRADMAVKISGETITISVKGNPFPAKIKIDPSKKPAHIDINPTEGAEKGKTFPGIYAVEKGELTLAWSEKGDRPKDFKGEGDALVLKLKKDEK